MRDPQAFLVRLVEVEHPDPRVDEVVCDLHPGCDECLELPHRDVGGCGMRQGDHGKDPVWDDILEVSPEGGHQLAWGCVGVDVVDCLQFLPLKGVGVALLWWSGGWGCVGVDVVDCLQFLPIKGVRVPLLWCQLGWGAP